MSRWARARAAWALGVLVLLASLTHAHADADAPDGFVLLSSLLAETLTSTTSPPEAPRLDLLSLGSGSEDQQKQIGDLEAWVMSMARDKVAVDNTTLGFVREIQRMVEDMIPQVLNRTAESEEELRRLLEAFSLCRLSGVEENLEDHQELKSRHLYCRRNESHQAIASAEAQQVWFAGETARKSECNKFLAIDVIPSHDECGVPQHPDAMRYYAEALRNKFKNKYDEWTRRKESCDTAAESTEALLKRKVQLEEQHQQLRALCNSLQDELDHRACSKSVNSQRHCHSYQDCYERARSSFLEQNKTVAALEQEMKQEYRALKRIVCILTAFEGGLEEKELEACRLQTVNLHPVGIDWASFPLPPLFINCSARQEAWPSPSSATYAAEVYGELPEVPLKECSAVPCCQALYS